MGIYRKMNAEGHRELTFNRTDYRKHDSASIFIGWATITLGKEDVTGDVQVGKYDTNSVPITLSDRHLDRMKEIEEDVNEYLETEGADKVKLVYGKKIYAKIKKYRTFEISICTQIKLKSVYVKGSKSYPQLYIL